MIKLNLAYSEKSDIVFSKINYPDGQNDVRILNFLQSNKTTLSFEDIKNSEVEIVSRFNNFIDLEFILAATQSLRELGCEDISLRIPSLFSARCDRKFVEGGNSYLKDITAPILNLQNYSSVTVVDVHNFKQAKRRIHNLVNESKLEYLVKEALAELKGDVGDRSNFVDKKCYIISPDKGAKPRTEVVQSTLIGWKTEVVQCDKVRDMATSKIIGLDVPKQDFEGLDCVIVDDICSRGGTFVEITKILKQKNCGKVYLIVAHYEGTADINLLKKSGIEKIFTTNSMLDINNDFIKQINVF